MPGVRNGAKKRPCSSVVNVCVPCAEVTATVTPGRERPCGSVTCPPIDPLVTSCAAAVLDSASASPTASIAYFMMTILLNPPTGVSAPRHECNPRSLDCGESCGGLHISVMNAEAWYQLHGHAVN